ncbi:MAG: response regulator [Magnetococcales bacterium]|nr:response regulator [Magnetococcales bacterium]
MPLKVLIVDDNAESIALLEDILGDSCDCFVATSGQKALELFERAITDNVPFDVVLLDIVMPGMDGIETLKRMRKAELSKQVRLFGKTTVKTRIIMQTASTDPTDFMSSFIEGRCNGYVTKPYSRQEILEKVIG